MRVPTNTTMQLQLLRKSTPLSLCRAPLENWPVGVLRYSERFSGGSGGTERAVWRFCAGVQW